jgi:hypothetical protein
MRASAVASCLLALAACGASGGAKGPSDLAGGRPDGAAPAPDAAPDISTSRDAPHAEVPAADVTFRDAIPMLEDAMLAGPCGVAGAKCPSYLGSNIWPRDNSVELAGSTGPDGAIYIGGTVDNTFDFDPTQGVDTKGTEGQPSGFLMKLSPTGAYESTLTITGDTFGNVPIEIAAPAVTAAASFVPGYFDGTVDLDPGPGVDTVQSLATRGGTFISKFDAAGKFVWGRVLASSESGLVYWGGPVALPDGGVVLTGTYVGPSDLDPGPAVLSPPTQSGAFVTRLDASGNQLWVRTLGCDGFSSPSMNAALDSGSVLWLSGIATDGSCAFDQGGPAAPAAGELYVASMTLDGNIRTYGTVLGSNSLIGPPVVASDDTIYLAGHIGTGQDAVSPIDVDPSAGVSNRNVPDTGLEFAMKLDHDGKLIWLQAIDLDLTSFASFALAPDDGLILATGWRSGPAGMSILRLDSGGNEVWRLRSGGMSTFPDAVLVNGTGFFVLGEQAGPGDLDPSTGVDLQSGPIWFLSKYAF